MNYVELSKTISYALRHKPEEFGLVLDSDGYVLIRDLCSALNCSQEDIYHIINIEQNKPGAKKRFELLANKIRACYGHSTKQVEMTYDEAIPPKILYHGTPIKNKDKIYTEGLKPMKRQFVHMSEDIETALIVGDRYAKGDLIAVFEINTEEAIKDGIKFYKANDTTWLTKEVNPKYFYCIDIRMKE